MAKSDTDLFERLRSAGLRKQVARTLSEIEGAGRKAQRAAHGAVAEMRALADELERRLSAAASAAKPPAPAAGRRAKPAAARTAPKRAVAGAAPKRAATRAAARPAAVKPPAATRAPARTAARGSDNRARVLATLKAGPKTASEIAAASGMPTSTVASALRSLTASGAVVKATRGYGLAE
jgi:IclR helix-turn-helix domain